ncbi:MAG: nucleotidyltransferase family protein [Candidatus Micrarchaeia archaeon]
MKRQEIIKKITSSLVKHGVPKAYLFGSFARKEKEYNDIDIAIEPPKGKFSLLDLIGVEEDISGKVHAKIDIVTLRSISPRLKPYIKKDMVLLYESG